jgi:hypothetical protein
MKQGEQKRQTLAQGKKSKSFCLEPEFAFFAPLLVPANRLISQKCADI